MLKTYLNSSLIDSSKAAISVYDRGLQYGDSVYEIIMVYNQRLIDLEPHLERLHNSAKLLRIDIAAYEKSIHDEAISLPMINKCHYGYIYIQVTRGINPLNIDDFSNITPTIIISSYTKKLYVHELNSKTTALQSCPDPRWKHRDIKVNSLVAASLSRIEAKEHGYDDVVYYNEQNYITESSRANIFIITKDNVIVTPPLDKQLLAGITRKRMLTLLHGANIPHEIRNISLNEAKEAQEAFLTGSVSVITAVLCIDEVKFAAQGGPLVTLLNNLYSDFIMNSASK